MRHFRDDEQVEHSNLKLTFKEDEKLAEISQLCKSERSEVKNAKGRIRNWVQVITCKLCFHSAESDRNLNATLNNPTFRILASQFPPPPSLPNNQTVLPLLQNLINHGVLRSRSRFVSDIL
jgi:hypothetical protein